LVHPIHKKNTHTHTHTQTDRQTEPNHGLLDNIDTAP